MDFKAGIVPDGVVVGVDGRRCVTRKHDGSYEIHIQVEPDKVIDRTDSGETLTASPVATVGIALDAAGRHG